jgi:prepilin-type N-terminal cleavage/methylation domain-containing protein
MFSSTSNLRRGMTLVELLVVVAIMGLLAITVIPSLSANAERRRSREAARIVSSFIAKSQSRAIGRLEWAGFEVAAIGPTSFAAMDLSLADVPPIYRGDTVPALVVMSGTPSITQRRMTGVAGLADVFVPSGTATISAGDLVSFDATGPAYQIVTLTANSLTFTLRNSDDAGNQPSNTPWPPSNAWLSFEIFRQPSTTGSPVALPAGRAVDLYWSGFGPATPTLYRRFDINSSGTSPTAGASTSVMFDSSGRLRQIMVRNASRTATNRLNVTGPIFLLVGRADRAGQGRDSAAGGDDDSIGANWQYADSVWVSIDPSTGAVRTAECKPNAVGANDVEMVLDSQQWIRQALQTGGN